MDGLRFDAVHAIGGRRAKGLEGKEFIARFAKEIRKQKPEFILFSENHLSVRAMQDQLGMSANWPNPEGWQRGRDDEFAEERRNLTNMWRSLTRLHRSLPALRTNLPRDSDVFHETLRPVDTRNDVVVIHRRNDGGAGMLIVIRFGTGADFERSYQIGCPASGA